jgi:hypothetical protein
LPDPSLISLNAVPILPDEVLFNGLTAGTTYVMQLCGIGGSTGKSDWSDPVSKIAL